MKEKLSIRVAIMQNTKQKVFNLRGNSRKKGLNTEDLLTRADGRRTRCSTRLPAVTHDGDCLFVASIELNFHIYLGSGLNRRKTAEE